jgi:hypothetical protein
MSAEGNFDIVPRSEGDQATTDLDLLVPARSSIGQSTGAND